MQAIVKQANELSRFSKKGIWEVDGEKWPLWKKSLLRLARTILLTVHGAQTDRLPLRSSALTFYTLLSVVPVAAMAFGIAKGFGFEKVLEKQLFERFATHQEAITQIVAFAQNMLDNTRGGMIAGIGVAVLFWSVIKVLTHIETAFNHIWKIEEPRTWMRRFSDYLSMMIFTPLLIVVASSISVFVTTQIQLITEKIALLGYFSFLTVFLIKLLPFLLIWLLFTFVYMVMPNTRVRFSAGLTAGVIAGSIYMLVQWAYIFFQVGIAQSNAIYGSFAALPLFLIWLQISWLILLIGAEIAFAWQNVELYAFGPNGIQLSTHQHHLAALDITQLLIKRFNNAQPPINKVQIAQALGLPLRLVSDELDKLVAVGLFAHTEVEGQAQPAYLPTGDIKRYTIQFVTEKLDRHGEEKLSVSKSERQSLLAESLEAFRRENAQSKANRMLAEL